jgi:hypothetical protein
MPEKIKRQRFQTAIRIRTPGMLADAVARAANDRMTTASEYVRQAILARLKADGIEPSRGMEAA